MADIKIDTGRVAQAAKSMETLNKQLRQELDDSQSTIAQLSSSWEGQASDDTRKAYDSFAKKYFQEYEAIIKDYVSFLNAQVDEGYVNTETSNESMADLYK